jgi:hypothetical protein
MEDAYWECNGLHGFLSHGDCSVPVKFDVSCDAHGRLAFTFQRMPMTDDTMRLSKPWHKTERYATPFTLAGSSDDDTTVSTEYFHISTFGKRWQKGEGSSIKLEGSTSWLEVSQPAPEATATVPIAIYRVIGLEGFSVLRTEVAEGQLEILGATRPTDHSKITGIIRFMHEQNEGLSSWINRCDERTDLVLDVLSLVLDCRLQWSIRDVYDPANKRVTILFCGPAPQPARPEHPVLSDLHLQPAIELIQNYTVELRDDVGLGTALALFLMRPPYIEPRFITAMAGLDHMLQRLAEHLPSGRLLDKKLYRTKILPKLRASLTACITDVNEELADDVGDVLSAKLGELNQMTMSQRLFAFLKHHDVPTDSITDEQLRDLIRVRNDLFHGRGFIPRHDGERLSDHVAVLHELLQRIFLTLLGYHGDRWTFLNGQEWVKFPPTE